MRHHKFGGKERIVSEWHCNDWLTIRTNDVTFSSHTVYHNKNPDGLNS